MELKPISANCSSLSERTFNRTSMELKLKQNGRLGLSELPFNRTSMELKHTYWRENARENYLLIEPVWN